MRQISLLPAGAQPWNFDIVAVQGNRFAYCATLAVYIYEVVALTFQHEISNYFYLSMTWNTKNFSFIQLWRNIRKRLWRLLGIMIIQTS